MVPSKFKMLFTIKSKLIIFTIVGILGVSSISIINKYFDNSKNKDVYLGRLSQEIATNILNIMLIEDQLISSSNNDRSAYKKERNVMRTTMTLVKENAKNSTIQKAADDIFKLETEHAAIFKDILQTLVDLNGTKEAYNKNNERISQHLKTIIKSIDTEDTELMMEGELLSVEKMSARKETVDFLSFGNERLINLLSNLLIYNDLEKYLEKQKEIEKAMGLAMKNLATIYMSAQSEEFNQAFEKIKIILKTTQQQEVTLLEQWMKSRSLMPQLDSTGKEVKKTAIEIAKMARLELNTSMRKANYNNLLVSFIVIISLIILGFFITKGIIQPIGQTVDMLKDIAQGEGDLTKRLAIKSEDEIGELAEWFNVFIEKIHGIINHISLNSDHLSQSATQLSNVSQEMSLGAETACSKATSVSAAAEQMSSNMSSVAAAAEESSTNISMVSAAAEEMTSTINEIAQNTERTRDTSSQAVRQTQKASENISTLSKSAQEIGKVVETINDISEQTNLLALNATIEAARAGEAGKGFAVVASEIKSLAHQTAEATLGIKEKIGGIQSSTQETVAEIEEVTIAINSVNEMIDTVAAAVEEQSATTKEIASNVTQASKGIQDVTENVTQSSAVANEIAQDIADVNRSSTEMSTNSAQVNTNAEALNQLSGELSKTVDQFKI